VKTRRQLLAGIGTAGAASLAGCSSLPFGDEDTDDPDVDVPAGTVEPIEWPVSPYPITVPTAISASHRQRARELLDDVPADPSIPNQAVADELASERERAERLDEEPEDPWALERLSEWRGRRGSAANVLAAYRAATGEDDGPDIADRRRTLRRELGSFAADYDYRAAATREAVLAHAPIEDLLSSTRRRLSPDPGYPDEPLAAPFQAGDAAERIEVAAATLSDARRLRTAYLDARSNAPARWESLIDASDRLHFAVRRTRSTVSGFLGRTESPFDRDLEGTAAERLFQEAAQEVETLAEDVTSFRADGQYANAVIAAGRTLAAVEALRAVIIGIREETYIDDVTVDSVERTAQRAQDALAAVEETDTGRLATAIVRPVLATYEYAVYRVRDDHEYAARLQGDLAWVELYARAVPAATEFVVERLDVADG